MPITRTIVAALVVWLALPVPIVLRIRLQSSGASAADVQRVADAFRRGFYSDSTVTAPAETLDVRRISTVPRDSASWRRTGTTVLLDGSVAATGDIVEVRLRTVNLLMQTLTVPETVRVRREAIDSTLAATGHTYASVLARRFGNRVRSSGR